MSGILIPVFDSHVLNVGITAGQSGSSIGYDQGLGLGSVLPSYRQIGDRIFSQLIWDNVLDELQLRIEGTPNPLSTWLTVMLFNSTRWTGAAATYFYSGGPQLAVWTWSGATALNGSMVNGSSYPLSIYTALPL
jgi:hypothetical protein